MIDAGDYLRRIAEALERISPPDAIVDWHASPAYVWEDTSARAIARIDAPDLARLRGIDSQKALVTANVQRLARGQAAHDMLLWGARGMGKSALLRASVRQAQADTDHGIALVQIAPGKLSSLSALFGQLDKERDRNFLLFIDDLGFSDTDSDGPRRLRSWLEGGVEARPPNVRLAVTSNRRVIVPRHASEQDDPINPRDAVDDKLALADRFGLSIGFHACSQDDYLDMIESYAKAYGLSFAEADALEWSRRRGARSGRVAWQYVSELAGRTGRSL